MEVVRKVRRAHTPPPFSENDCFKSGNFKLRQRTPEDIKEAASLLGVSYEDAADMNSKEIERYMEIRRLILTARSNLHTCMTKEGATSTELAQLLAFEQKNTYPHMREDDPAVNEAKRAIIRLKFEEKQEEARVRIRKVIAEKDNLSSLTTSTASELEEALKREKRAGELLKDDVAVVETNAVIARLQAWSDLRECLAKASDLGNLRRIDELNEHVAEQKKLAKLLDDDPVIGEVRERNSRLLLAVEAARSSIHDCVSTLGVTSVEITNVLEREKLAGKLDEDDLCVIVARKRIEEERASEEHKAGVARANIREGIAKFKSSVKLLRLLATEQPAGALVDDDPAVCEIKARIKELQDDGS